MLLPPVGPRVLRAGGGDPETRELGLLAVYTEIVRKFICAASSLRGSNCPRSALQVQCSMVVPTTASGGGTGGREAVGEPDVEHELVSVSDTPLACRTEPGVHPDSSTATCGFTSERPSGLRRRPFPIFRELAALGGKSPSEVPRAALKVPKKSQEQRDERRFSVGSDRSDIALLLYPRGSAIGVRQDAVCGGVVDVWARRNRNA